MIDIFRGEYRYLSNYYEAPVIFEGRLYMNSESAYQAAKIENNEDRWAFEDTPPNLAKKLGQKAHLREDWEDVKDEIMYRIVKDKFTRNIDLGKKLVETYPEELIEGNNWHDNYWGICNCHRCKGGLNKLGKILERVREELMV